MGPTPAHLVSPTDDVAGELSQVRPWVRYWARIFDLYLFALLLGFAFAFVAPGIVDSTFFFYVTVLVSWPVIESVLLATLGNTPGKALLRVHIETSDGRKLKFKTALGRSFAVWLRGLGCGVPIVSLVTLISAYNTLKKDGEASWDSKRRLMVWHETIGWIRCSLVVLFFGAVVFLISHSEAKRLPGLANSPLPPTATTSNPGAPAASSSGSKRVLSEAAARSERAPEAMRFDPSTAKAEEDSPAPASALNHGDPVAIFKAAAKSVVLIKTFSADGTPLALGSGFFLSDDLLITNAHVIEDSARVEVVGDRGNQSVTQVAALDSDGDLVALVASGPTLQISQRTPDVGERVFVIGNPKGLAQTFSDGLVSSVRELEGTKIIQISAPISPGSSGGPVLDGDGRVLGVASFAVRGGQNLNFAISSARIEAMLKNREQSSIVDAVARIAASNNPERKAARSKGRVEIVRVDISTDFASRQFANVSLHNHEDYPVTSVTLRVLYFEDPAEVANARLAKIDTARRRLATPLASDKNLERVIAEKEAYLRLLNTDPSRWKLSDLGVMPEYGGITSTMKAALTWGDSTRELYLQNVRAEIPREKIHTSEELAQLRDQLQSFQNASTAREQELGALKKQEEEIRASSQAAATTAPRMLDYSDYVSNVVIEPNLAKTVSLQLTDMRPGWKCEIKAIDYEVTKP